MSAAQSEEGTPKDINYGVGVILKGIDGLFAGIRRADNHKTQLPAGFLREGDQPGEDAPEGALIVASEHEYLAAARELLEEVGIEVDCKDLVPIHVTSTSRSRRYVFFALKPGAPYKLGTPTTPEEGEPVWTMAETLRASHRTNAAAFDKYDALFPAGA